MIVDHCGREFTTAQVEVNDNSWQKYTANFEIDQDLIDGRLELIFPENSHIAIDMVSLFPKHTFKNRSNGCRKDIADKLAEMHPKFLRFPGGCLIHDGSLNSGDRDGMYRWKNTIGPIEERATKRNSWGYNQTFGLGFYELFQFAEDINATPIPVLSAGWDPHHQHQVPMDQLQPWIDDALDLIEFANGSTTSKWGTVRAEMGHPESFGLRYLGIGNEEVGQEFFDRYELFHKQIRSVYPKIRLINSSGPFAAGSEFKRGWNSAFQNGSDLVDEHYYQSPNWFLANQHRYDHYDVNGPKVFLGEYASKAATWESALAEASYMIGIERNADKVGLACYAPLLVNDAYENWQPDLLRYDQHRVFGSPSYEVQRLFMIKQGDEQETLQQINLPDPVVKKHYDGQGGLLVRGDGADIIYRNFILSIPGEAAIHLTDGHIISGEEDLFDSLPEQYRLNFEFIKTGGRKDKGFQLVFGHKSNGNELTWTLGGWQNQDSIISLIEDDQDSVLTQSIWHAELNKRYQCELIVDRTKVTAKINGVKIHSINLPLVQVESIYADATFDKSKRHQILKFVNVQNKTLQIVTKGWRSANLELVCLQGDLDIENSFERPRLIIPKKSSIIVNNETVELNVPAQSVCVLEEQD